MALYIRELESQEQKQLEVLLGQPETDLPVNRLLIVKLSAEGWRVHQHNGQPPSDQCAQMDSSL